VIFAVSDILASHADLTLTIKALSEHLDALDQITAFFSSTGASLSIGPALKVNLAN
jgi:hypothetical protein